MRHEDLFYVLALLKVEGVGDIVAKKLLTHYQEPALIFKTKASQLTAIDGIGTVLLRKLKDKTIFQKAEAELHFIEKNNIAVSYFQEENYPDRLKHCVDGPVLLFTSGNIQLKNRKINSKKSSEQPVASKETAIETGKQSAIAPLPLKDNPIALLSPEQEKQNLINPADSNNLEQTKNTPSTDLAQVENKPEDIKTPDYRSLHDILTTRLKEKLVGKDELKEKEKNSTFDKISGWDIAGAFAKGLSKVTGNKIEIKPQYNSEGNVTAYALSAGKLEFSRVK